MPIIQQPLQQYTQDQLHRMGIHKIIFDSHDAEPGALFCALVGLHTNGHHFIDAAKAKGVQHFLISESTAITDDDCTYLLTDDTRQAMATLASVLYNAPSTRIKTIGVTGTDGKSTTSYLIQQLLEMLGHPTGLMSTVSFNIDGHMADNLLRQSTPEAPQIEAALASMIDHGLEYAVVESTSHGLSPKTGRLSHIVFAAGVFTNVTIEHLEFHHTLEQYRDDKANLFRQLSPDGFGVINAQDAHAQIYIDACGTAPSYTYGLAHRSTVWAENVQAKSSGNSFELCCADGRATAWLPLPGLFNIDNALAAVICVSQLLHCSPLSLVPHLAQLKGAKGRMVVVQDQPFTVIVDYGHTPGSFEKLLPQVKSITPGRLLAVFGSGGERNVEKRPIQGQLADQYADIVILTDEDPRLEDGMQILKDIVAGVKNKVLDQTLFLIRNRRAAIAHAIALAQPGDTVILLGKGHESCIIDRDEKIAWDEEAVARELLQERQTFN